MYTVYNCSYKYSSNADGLIEFAILLEDSQSTQNASSLNFNAKAFEVVENDETHMKQPSAKLVFIFKSSLNILGN